MGASVRMISGFAGISREAQTKAGTTDLNDMPRFEIKPGSKGRLLFTVGNETRELAFDPLESSDPTIDAVWSELTQASPAISALSAWLADKGGPDDSRLKLPMSREDAETALKLLGGAPIRQLHAERKDELEAKSIAMGGRTLRWQDKTFGEAPEGERSLWISMHGGGGTPAAVNDGQWQNQIRLYEPAEGIYLAPRAPTDTWNLWHEAHIDPMFQRLIEDHIALRGVDPDKVYLMGYSASGDGIWQLAPRMADRFAAAAMMAGHPNEATLSGLRNLPFAVFMGGDDAAYNRSTIPAAKSVELDQLGISDPPGYIHLSRIYDGLGHWMDRKDAEALPWLAKYHRNSWPKKIVWLQDDVTHDRFYWLKIPDKAAAKAGQKIVASIDGRTIRLDGDVPPKTELRLSDNLLDLDQKITVIVNGKPGPNTTVTRSASAIQRCLEERLDLPAAGFAILILP